MTFYILLSTAAILTAVVGCALIWGYDVARAREIARDEARRPPKPEPSPELATAPRPQLGSTTAD